MKRTALRAFALLSAVGLFAWTLRDLDTAALGALLGSIGPGVLLVLLPQAAAILLHAAAWRELLNALGHRVPLFGLASTHLGAEATRMVAPLGAAVGESVAAFALTRRFDVPWMRSLASLALKKAWVLCTNAACLILLALIAERELERLASTLPQGELLPWLLWGMTALLAIVGMVTLALLSSHRVAGWVARLSSHAPWERLRRWAKQHRAAAAKAPAKHAAAAFFLFGQWMVEVVETWLILRLLGVQVSFAEALVVELGGSLVRSLAFVVPGGLGVQDASYVGALAALGIPGATEVGATFVVLKRAKELAYVTVGLFLLALAKRHSSAHVRESSAR